MSAGLPTDECAVVDGLLIAPYEMAIMKIFEYYGLNKNASLDPHLAVRASECLPA